MVSKDELKAGIQLLRFIFTVVCIFASFSNGLAALELDIEIDGVVYAATAQSNDRLLDNIVLLSTVENPSDEVIARSDDAGAAHLRGQIIGFDDSDIRLSTAGGYWRGLVVFADSIYRIEQQRANDTGSDVLHALPIEAPDSSHQMCQTPHAVPNNEGEEFMFSPIGMASAAESNLSPFASSGSTLLSEMAVMVSASCPDPVEGICLLPELEIAYDISYQNIFSVGETLLDRATRELNELEMFFERSFNYRFSRVSMTFLDATQDAVFSSYTTAADLLDELRLARNRGELPFIQSPRSIFHFMTGRNFAPINEPADSDPSNDINVVGIAYLDVFCSTFGLNTGLTDAGDAFLVSLVMAHEIGHNLGSPHDDPSANGCSTDTHVMTPSLGAGAASITEFSSCSVGVIEQVMTNTLASANRSLCLDFPVDFSISPDVSNTSSPDEQSEFSSLYAIQRIGGAVGTTGITITGTLSDADSGCFTEVSVANGACSYELDSFTCSVGPASSIETLTVNSIVDQDASRFEYTQTVSIVSGDGVEMKPIDNTLVTRYDNFSGTVGVDVCPEGSAGTGQSVGGNSPPTSTTSSGGGSGGGGGSAGVSMLTLLLLVLCNRLIGCINLESWPRQFLRPQQSIDS